MGPGDCFIMLTLGNLKVNAVAVGTIITDSPRTDPHVGVVESTDMGRCVYGSSGVSSLSGLSKIRHEILKGAYPLRRRVRRSTQLTSLTHLRVFASGGPWPRTGGCVGGGSTIFPSRYNPPGRLCRHFTRR
jgi:hypothetical protein